MANLIESKERRASKARCAFKARRQSSLTQVPILLPRRMPPQDGTVRTASNLCVAVAASQAPPSPAPPPPLPPAPPAPPAPPPYKTQAKVSIDTAKPVAQSSDGFVSFNFDWHLDSEEVPVWENSASRWQQAARGDSGKTT